MSLRTSDFDFKSYEFKICMQNEFFTQKYTVKAAACKKSEMKERFQLQLVRSRKWRKDFNKLTLV